MQNKEQKLKQIIVNLRMQLFLRDLGDDCICAHYNMKPSGCELGIGCSACKERFIKEMATQIEKEVAQL